MKELSAHQIAAALSGHPNSQWLELRLLMLFQSDDGDPLQVEQESTRQPLRKAA
jgi:hypothetical protein